MTQEKQQPKVRLFVTPGCVYCITLKMFFDEHNIKFEEIDVAEDEKAREEMIKKSEQMEVPVLEINGEIIVGFDRKRIVELLEIKE